MSDHTMMSGKPFEGSDDETLNTIRAILTEETAAAPAAQGSRRAAKAFVDRTVSAATAPRRRSADLPALEDAPASDPKPRRAVAGPSRLSGLLGKVTAFRPTTRHLAIVSVLLLAVVRPMWFVIGGLVAIVLVVGLFLTLGSQRIWAAMQRYVERVERKDAVRGARLRHGLDRFACRWDSVLDMLPDGMADDLYMPDFHNLNRDKVAELDQAVLERLDRMADRV